ncbi:MAG: phage tail tape measure protein [Lachnospiraceae bacterium]|nr:phage tail tape measure protein [Lachnospiraceae bacterium]
MAIGKNIKGITIEFNGDTTKLGKALKEVDSKAKGVDASLRDVNKALRFNPGNTELLAQKQQLLGQKIEQTKGRLDALKDAQAKLDDDPAVDKTSQDYMELQREIIETESKLKHFGEELKKVDNYKFEKVGGQIQKIGDKAKSAGQKLTQYVTVPLAGGGAAAVKLASDYEENLNKIDVAFGNSSDKVKDWANNAMQEFGLSKVAATGAVSAFGALGKGIGLTDTEAAGMSTTLAGLSADLASYFNTSNEDSAKALESIFTGETEALKRFGIVMTDTNLEKFAADQGLVWKEMSQAEKTTLRYQYVLSKTKDAQGDYSRTSKGTANSMKTFKAAVEDLGVAVGKHLLPLITPLVQKLTKWITKFSQLDPKTQKIITTVGLLAAALGPVLTVGGFLLSGIGKFITTIPRVIGMISKVGRAFTLLRGILMANPWMLVAAAAIAAVVLIIKNWDKIKAFFSKLWTAVKNIASAAWNRIKEAILAPIRATKQLITALWNGIKSSMTSVWNKIRNTASNTWNRIKTAITSPIRKAADVIRNLVEKIKGFFHFKFRWPHIKLPHFSIHPRGWKIGDLLKGSIPSLGIDWYAKGGIFTKPTIIGNKGFGEAGAEAVLPLSELWDQMGTFADSIVNGFMTAMQLQQTSGDITIENYLYPSSVKMGEVTVKTYDRYKKILG